ncbi:MAG: nitrogen fixation protein NifH, partial [Candidatus Heimdallarchaeota archaeon]
YLNSDPIDWLLEDNNPSVRYFTLRDLMNLNENNTELREAKAKIMTDGLVPKILSKQKAGGYWETAENFYIRTKYKGTIWQFLVLTELAADNLDDRIQKTCEFILENSQDKFSGAFAYYSGENGGDHHKILPCLTGNMLWGLISFGYLGDSRVQKGINWIVEYQRFDDGLEHAPDKWPYNVGSKKGEACWGKHTCYMCVVKNLKALAEIPPSKKSNSVRETIDKAVEYILNHHIYKQSHNLSSVAKQEWTQFGFPLMWKVDALEILDILTKLGYKDDRMLNAIDLVISKQNDNARWTLEKTFNGRMQVNIEQKGKESKWITLFALRILKRFYS